MGYDISMVNAAILLESLSLIAGKIQAETTVDNAFLLRTCPNLTLRAPGVDIEAIRATPLAGKALQFVALADSLFQEVLAFWKRGTIVITCITIESTDPQH
ncbi:MAG: hypothetical protein P8186_06615 [Anaerolineae bacterium]|jgi:hypothetical protein